MPISSDDRYWIVSEGGLILVAVDFRAESAIFSNVNFFNLLNSMMIFMYVTGSEILSATSEQSTFLKFKKIKFKVFFY